jgi:hypothetical protein
MHYFVLRFGALLLQSSPLICHTLLQVTSLDMGPYAFWERQRLFSPESLSWNRIAGCFMVYSANAAVTPEILKSNGPASLQLVLHPNGVKVLGGLDISLKLGEEHRRLRKSFLPSSPARP